MTSVRELALVTACCRVCDAPQLLTASGNVRTHRDASGAANCAGSCRKPRVTVDAPVAEPAPHDGGWFGVCPKCKEPQRVDDESLLAVHAAGAARCAGSETLVGRWLPVVSAGDPGAETFGVCAVCDQLKGLNPQGQVVDHLALGLRCHGAGVMPQRAVSLETALPRSVAPAKRTASSVPAVPAVPASRAAAPVEQINWATRPVAAAPAAQVAAAPRRPPRLGKILVALLLLLGVGSWIAHAGSSSPAPSPYSSSSSNDTYSDTYSDTSSTPLDASDVADTVYVTVVRQNAEHVSGDADATIIEVGHQICSLLRDGMSVRSLSLALLSEGISGRNVGVFVGAATPAYCPDQDANARAFFSSVG